MELGQNPHHQYIRWYFNQLIDHHNLCETQQQQVYDLKRGKEIKMASFNEQKMVERVKDKFEPLSFSTATYYFLFLLFRHCKYQLFWCLSKILVRDIADQTLILVHSSTPSYIHTDSPNEKDFIFTLR